MKIKDLRNKIIIERNKEFVRSVQKKNRNIKLMKCFISLIIKAVLIFLLFGLIYFPITIKKEETIDSLLSYSLNYKSSENIHSFLNYSMDGALYELSLHNYKNAKQILLFLPQSDAKDWYLSLAYIGLNDFSNAEQLLLKIKSTNSHEFQSELTYDFYLSFYSLNIKYFYNKFNSLINN